MTYGYGYSNPGFGFSNHTRATEAERLFLAKRKNLPFFGSLFEQVARKGTLSPKQHAVLAQKMAQAKDLGNEAADAYATEMNRADALLDAYAAEQAKKAARPLPGIYEKNGAVYLVKSNKAKTNVYAKRLVPSAERMNELGEPVDFDFEYAQGAINFLTSADRMPFEKAESLSIRYGRCLECGRKLKAGKSVHAGIGPVCAKKMGAVL